VARVRSGRMGCQHGKLERSPRTDERRRHNLADRADEAITDHRQAAGAQPFRHLVAVRSTDGTLDVGSLESGASAAMGRCDYSAVAALAWSRSSSRAFTDGHSDARIE